MNRIHGWRANGIGAVTSGAVFIGLALWALWHAMALLPGRHGGTPYEGIYLFSFFLLFFQFAAYSTERPVTVSTRQQRLLDELNVTVVVPVYNEDPILLDRGLQSMLDQTRLPAQVFVVDDGSTATDYAQLRPAFLQLAAGLGIAARWERKDNGGKRSAQAYAFERTPGADVYVTVDSDSVLDRRALDEVLKPLADKRVLSVAGLVVAINATRNLLTRFTDLWWVTGQLVDRSAMSRFGSVLVNSGVLAAYRADLVRRHLDSYINESFMGRRVEYSDDSLLTLYALTEGRAVQQPSAIAFTAMPENMSHHVRQYMRWMRGAFIRSVWRFRYLPVNRFAYWAHFVAWVQTALAAILVVTLFVVEPIAAGRIDWWLFLVPLLIGYAQATRYLTVRRSDQTVRDQLLTYALVPVAWIWGYFGLRVMRWYAIATCVRMGWGTRETIEVSIAADGTELVNVA